MTNHKPFQEDRAVEIVVKVINKAVEKGMDFDRGVLLTDLVERNGDRLPEHREKALLMALTDPELGYVLFGERHKEFLAKLVLADDPLGYLESYVIAG